MIVVTGGAGFIGSNLVRALNERGREDILVVDDLSDGHKFANLVDCEIADYIDKDSFLKRLYAGRPLGDRVTTVYHLGACSVTTEWDGRYMLETNYEYSRQLLDYCHELGIDLVYASSAAVYGASSVFTEVRANERPLNVYGYSKFLFDQFVRRHHARLRCRVTGLRYFNVYGPAEAHKGAMASVMLHLTRQLAGSGKLRLFAGSDGYADGEQLRDFVHVGDAAAVTLWFGEHDAPAGIYNCGSGIARSFNDVARAIIDTVGRGEIEYIPFPDALRGAYQSFTCADLTALRASGCDHVFRSLEEGVSSYVRHLTA